MKDTVLLQLEPDELRSNCNEKKNVEHRHKSTPQVLADYQFVAVINGDRGDVKKTFGETTSKWRSP